MGYNIKTYKQPASSQQYFKFINHSSLKITEDSMKFILGDLNQYRLNLLDSSILRLFSVDLSKNTLHAIIKIEQKHR